MARIFITGSSDGLGLLAGRQLAAQGHAVTLHARNAQRAGDAWRALPAAEHVVTGDLSSIDVMRDVAKQANATGRFDAVIHNAAVGYRESPNRTEDGLDRVFAVNVLSAYVLTALMHRPDRLIYLSSGLHTGGHVALQDAQWTTRRFDGFQAYSDSKLYDVLLAFGASRRWSNVYSNAVEPGWVPTKMGGPGAPDDLQQGAETQAWLAVSEDPAARVSGRYFFHLQERVAASAARSESNQDALFDYCRALTSISFPTENQ